jgi:hypothetical protein
VMSQFWGRHQNFFRQVLIAYKVPTLLQQVERAIRTNQCAVIALMSTGEARTAVRAQQKAKAAATLSTEEADLDAFVSPPQEILRSFIDQHFPTTKNGKVVQAAADAKRDLLLQVSALPLPPNPLDAIIDHFGVDNV